MAGDTLMPFLPTPVMITDYKKRKKRPAGWRLESTRHSLARQGIKTWHKPRTLFQKTALKFQKAATISQRYQTKLERDQEHSYIARGMWGAGAIGGGVLGLVAGVGATGVPTMGLAGLVTGGMAGGTLGLTAYEKLPIAIKSKFQVNVRKEKYRQRHLPPNFLGLVPVPRKWVKKWGKFEKKIVIPSPVRKAGSLAEKGFNKAFFWYFAEAEKAGDIWNKSEKEVSEDMKKSMQFWKKKKAKKEGD